MMLPYDSQRQYYPKSLRDGLGSIQIALSYDQVNSILLVTVVSARSLRCREYNNTIIAPNPFVKVYLLPGRKVSNKRRTKYISNTANPEWHQTVEYLVNFHDIPSYYLELTVWNYDKYNDNICLGQVNLSLSDTSLFNNMTRSYPLQSPDQASVIHGLNNTPAAPTTRLRTQSYYNPSSLDLGYPAIC
jgi:Ca2+-dependent lipid-binding protein